MVVVDSVEVVVVVDSVEVVVVVDSVVVVVVVEVDSVVVVVVVVVSTVSATITLVFWNTKGVFGITSTPSWSRTMFVVGSSIIPQIYSPVSAAFNVK